MIDDNSKTTEVFEGTPWEVEIVKGMLESNGIGCVIKDEVLGSLAPYMAPTVSVEVLEKDLEHAKRLIAKHRAEAGEKKS